MDNEILPTPGKWRYGVQVIGIKKRCRKSARHIGGDNKCSIGEAQGEPTEREALELAGLWIADNMKTVERAIATATYWRDTGHGMEETRIFSDAWNRRWKMEVTHAASQVG